MKRIVVAVALFATPASAMPFPIYDIETACAEAAANAVKDGIDRADAIHFIPTCRSRSSMAKEEAERLWPSTSPELQRECAAENERLSEERGLSTGWYPFLARCLSPSAGRG